MPDLPVNLMKIDASHLKDPNTNEKSTGKVKSRMLIQGLDKRFNIAAKVFKEISDNEPPPVLGRCKSIKFQDCIKNLRTMQLRLKCSHH